MKRIIPMLIAVALIIVVGAVYLGPMVLERYSYSRDRADLDDYFEVRGEDDVPIIMGHELIEEHARMFGSFCYMLAEDVDSLLNGRFYEGVADKTLVYTTPTDIITADIGSGQWSSTDGSSGDERYQTARYDGEDLYICVDYVKKFTNFDYELYDSPRRMVLVTSWEPEQRVRTVKKTEVRLRGGVKSEILCDAAKDTELTLLEEMETWSKVETEDGFIGYVENKRLSDPEDYTPERLSAVEEPEYTSISRPWPINLGWHGIYGESGNSTFDEVVGGTNAGEENGLNVIAPTWFQLSDGEGNILSFAEESYIDRAHGAGLEVWGVVDNFNNEGADTASSLSRAAYRKNLIDSLIAEASRVGLDGINVDFEQVAVSSGEDFIEFIRELSIPCREKGLVLSVDNYVPMGSLNDHYDRKEQGVVADYIIVMGYDEHYKGSSEAGSVASIGYVEDGIRRTVAEVPSKKVIGAMPFYTRVWATNGGSVDSDALSMKSAIEWVEERGITLEWDDETCQNYGETTDSDGTLRQVWMEDEESINTKVTVMKTFDIAGVAAWRLGFETPEIWDVIARALGK